MTALELDKQKKWMTCLGCGKKMWTDRCHRICRKCRRRNNATPSRTSHGISLPGSASHSGVRQLAGDDW